VRGKRLAPNQTGPGLGPERELSGKALAGLVQLLSSAKVFDTHLQRRPAEV
jgi:hypothetical protein